MPGDIRSFFGKPSTSSPPKSSSTPPRIKPPLALSPPKASPSQSAPVKQRAPELPDPVKKKRIKLVKRSDATPEAKLAPTPRIPDPTTPPSIKKAAPPPQLPSCQWGQKCYDASTEHRALFFHSHPPATLPPSAVKGADQAAATTAAMLEREQKQREEEELQRKHYIPPSDDLQAQPKKVRLDEMKPEGPNGKFTKQQMGQMRAQKARLGGPPKLGQKTIPEGAPNCLSGKAFLVTGVLESLDRDATTDLIRRHGGEIKKSVPVKRITKDGKKAGLDFYAVVGTEPGPKKIIDINKHNWPVIDEEGLFDMLRQSMAGSASAPPPAPVQAPPPPPTLGQLREAAESAPAQWLLEKLKADPTLPPSSLFSLLRTSDGAPVAPPPQLPTQVVQSTAAHRSIRPANEAGELWTEKHRPQRAHQLIGNPGILNTMVRWLEQWKLPPDQRAKDFHIGVKGPFGPPKTGPPPGTVLLSGPPGIGKTTAALVACREAGYEVLEMNASDTRSKNSLKEHVSELLDNHTITEFFVFGAADKKKKTQCLIMDEVDGMSSGDRGGLAELVQLAKTTKTPIICCCNELGPKMKTLQSHSIDMRFRRATVNIVAERLGQIARHEGFEIGAQSVERLVESVGGDIRQALNLLQMWRTSSTQLQYDKVKTDMAYAGKNVFLGPFELTPKLFRSYEHRPDKVGELIEAYFADSSLMPLFIQENYLKHEPTLAGSDPLEKARLMALAADSISLGDNIEMLQRQTQSWSLMPVHGALSVVQPAYYSCGAHITLDPTEKGSGIAFPSALGRMSTLGKNTRLLTELRQHTALAATGARAEFGMSYLPLLRDSISHPLLQRGADGIPDAVELMEHYFLTRDDVNSIMELSEFPKYRDYMPRQPFNHIETKVKTAFTRKFNKEHKVTPFNAPVVRKGRGGGAEPPPLMDEDEEQEEEEEEVNVDALIAQKKKKARTAGGARGGRGRGRGAPRGGRGRGGRGRG